jgi:hypothetical protein
MPALNAQMSNSRRPTLPPGRRSHSLFGDTVSVMPDMTRQRDISTRCPKCDGGLLSVEEAVILAEEPLSWTRVRFRCAAGCALVAGDVAEDAA